MYYYGSPKPGYGQPTLECVTVSVGYSDLLDETLRYNVGAFDRIVVVTTHDDSGTQSVCAKHSVNCVKTDEFTARGCRFNKGAGINIGLAHLRHDGWIVSIDADIALPVGFRNILAKAALDATCLYGVLRVSVVGKRRWMEEINSDEPQFSYRWKVHTAPDLPVGDVLVHKEYGFVPIGYFQMWHSSCDVRYPSVAGSAENDDVLFALQWPRNKRILLPHFRVYHLESERAEMGANWYGRTTKQWQ